MRTVACTRWLVALALVTGCSRTALWIESDSIEAGAAAALEAIAARPAQARAPVPRGNGEAVEGSLGPAPPGYVAVSPIAESGAAFGHAVLLIDPTDMRIVPIFISGTEALSIELRLANKPFGRPLTHDLLDAMLKKLGAKLVRAQVDSVREGIYIGTVVLEASGMTLSFDARPSDAIALAIGNHAPIFVSKKLLDEVGVRVDELDEEPPKPTAEPVAL